MRFEPASLVLCLFFAMSFLLLLEYGFVPTRLVTFLPTRLVNVNRRMLLVMVVCRNRVLCVPWVYAVVNLRHRISPLSKTSLSA